MELHNLPNEIGFNFAVNAKYQLNTLKNELLNFLNESAHCWRILPTKAESVNKI